jgi:hypothetical protein
VSTELAQSDLATDSDTTFDLVLGELEQDIPPVVTMTTTHIGTTPKSCMFCTCITVYCE